MLTSLRAGTLFAARLTLTMSLGTPALADETVNFPSLDGMTNLIAHLSRPAGDTPRPAVVVMHGCSGLLNPKGMIFPIYQAWSRALVDQGYTVLVVDSSTSRGFGQTCTPSPDRAVMWRGRPADAYAALQYLQGQPLVQADRVGLMGWSQGGGVVLLSINEKSIARPADLAHEFRAAVAFYPGSCSEKYQSKPYTRVDPQSWATKVPLLVLMGEADTWTPLGPCKEFLEAAQARGSPIELKTYPSAVHGFDAPNRPRTELPQYRGPDGRIPVVGTDPEARADAFPRVLQFLKLRLESN